jgi:hypothetical protein
MCEATISFKENVNKKIIHRQILLHYTRIYNICQTNMGLLKKIGDFIVECLGCFMKKKPRG